jgi:SPP1 gp7 family putative phage head morphogenesis protein
MKATTIPVQLELEYMLAQRWLLRDLSFLTIAKVLHEHRDSDELLDFLKLSAPQLLNEKFIRRRLRHLARTMTNEKLRELQVLLGRNVRPPFPGTAAQWINEQVLAIQATVERWLLEASAEIQQSRLKGMALADMTVALRQRAMTLSGIAEQRASAAVLQLNSKLIEEIAKGSGSSHYRWQTMEDDRVRPNHAELNLTVQAWADAPMGGGTKPDDAGHPGSGYGCRCTAIPLQGPPP